MGGGMPIGAFVAAKAIMDVIKDNPMLGHITTFGGHPVSCAAALASLNVILDEHLIDDVERKAQLFRQHLQHPSIREIRGAGLMLCIQLDTFEQVAAVSKYCADQGVIIDRVLPCATALRVSPPLIITDEDTAKACQLTLNALDPNAPRPYQASLPNIVYVFLLTMQHQQGCPRLLVNVKGKQKANSLEASFTDKHYELVVACKKGDRHSQFKLYNLSLVSGKS